MTSVLALPRKRLAHTCKRNIQMTPLCNIEVTPPRVVGSGGCTVVVLSMSKQEFNRHRPGNHGSQRPATRSAIFQPPLPLKLSVSTVSQSLDSGTVTRDESCLPHLTEITRL